jgi:hypothetical protein
MFPGPLLEALDELLGGARLLLEFVGDRGHGPPASRLRPPPSRTPARLRSMRRVMSSRNVP